MLTALLLLAAAGPAGADCIAIVESKVRPHAVNVNPNGSIDRGLFQINSIHLPELANPGIGPEDLHDVCLSSHVAALLLKRKMAALGDTWAAVGAYHSSIPEKRDAYAGKVRAVFERMRQLKLASGAQ